MRLKLILISGAGVLAAVTTLVFCILQANDDSAFRLVREQYERHLPRIIADIEALDKDPLFPDGTYERNAGPLISKHVSWEGRGLKPNELSRQAFEAFRQKYGGWQTDASLRETMLKDEALWKSFDSSWVAELKNYDHLDLSTHPAQSERLARLTEQSSVERIGTLSSLPMLSYSEFRTMVQLHALRLARDQQAVQGLQALRKAAQLTHTSGSLIGNMIAVSFLKDEHALAQIFHVKEWPLISRERIEQYRRVSWAWIAIVKAPLFGEIPPAVEPHLTAQAGLCAGVHESFASPLVLQEFLAPQFPFEEDKAPMLAAARERLARLYKTCHMDRYNALLQPPQEVPWILTGEKRILRWTVFGGEDGPIKAEINLAKIPFARRIFATWLENVAVPNFLALYERDPST